MTASLHKKVVFSVAWNLIERFGVQLTGLIVTLVLVRLLDPADFGLVALLSVFLALAEVLVQSGLGKAYIQSRNVSDIDASTVFISNLFISLFLYSMLWICSPLIADLYGNPDIVLLFRVMGLLIIISAFRFIQIAQLSRELAFKRKSKINLAATFLAGLVGISAALTNFGVWSLVAQQLSSAILMSIGYWSTSSWRPSLQFSLRSFSRLMSFGSWVLAAALLRTLSNGLYILVIGKYFSIPEVGFYTKAKQFQRIGSEQICAAVGTVAFPIFSRAQHEPEKLKMGMQKSLEYTVFIVSFLMATLIVIAEPLIHILLTEKWSQVVPYFQLFCIVGLLNPLHTVNVQALQAQGKGRLNFKISIIKNTLRIISFFLTYRWGIEVIIVGEIVVSCLSLLINTYYTNIFVSYGLSSQLSHVRMVFLSALMAVVLGYIVCSSIEELYAALLVGSLYTTFVYIATQYLFNRRLLLDILRLRYNFLK